MSASIKKGVAFQAMVHAGIKALAAEKTRAVRAKAGISPDIVDGPPKVTFNYLVNQACRELLNREKGEG